MKSAILFLSLIAVVLGQNVSSPSDLGGADNSTGSPPTTSRSIDVIGVGNATSSGVETSDATEPSTAGPPPTTPAPPAPSPVTWQYNETADKYCILLTSTVQFHLGYETDDGKVEYTTFNALANGSVSSESQCGNLSAGQDAVLAIAYGPLNLTYTFAAVGSSKYALTELKIEFVYDDSDLFPSHKNDSQKRHVLVAHPANETYAVSNGKSYRCDVERSISFDDFNSTVKVGSLKFVAFGEHGSGDFGDAEECSDDFTTSDIVPIAVGCALAALVVIVLIAYLIGRRRSRQKGYQSV